MKYQLSENARLTDYVGGRLTSDGAYHSVLASDLAKAIALHFREANDWAAFSDESDAAQALFDDLLEAGIVKSVPARTGLLRPEVTMFDVPFRRIEDVSGGEIVFLGAPIDVGTTGYPGARYGPHAIRSASVERFSCKIDIQTGRMIGWNVPSMGGGVLDGARLSDLGDLCFEPGQPVEGYYDHLRQVVGRIYAAGAFPVILGGDHSVTYATVPDDAATLIHLDAHCDLAERRVGHCHHHGNVVRRLIDEGRVGEVYHLGLRETAGWDTLNCGTFAKSVGDLEREGWERNMHGKRAFVSLDVDVLDPSVMPATGTPVVGGLTLRTLCQVLARVVQVTQPVGLDIVELCPIRDDSGLSERNVIEALLGFLSVYHSTMAGVPSES